MNPDSEVSLSTLLSRAPCSLAALLKTERKTHLTKYRDRVSCFTIAFHLGIAETMKKGAATFEQHVVRTANHVTPT